jgi:ubiquinone/menaquinone biosynthesis C-methylase UbiE
MRALWRRIVVLGFRLLYHELAWSYDLVSWLASRGLWRRWQQAALAYLPVEGRFLEVGFGPGHLLLDLVLGPGQSQAGRYDGLGRHAQRGVAVRGAQGPSAIQEAASRRQVFGLDLSPAMLHLARRRLVRQAVSVPLVQGRAQALPFVSGTFDAIVLTFPTPFVYEGAWIRDLARVLYEPGEENDASGQGGRLVVVEQAEFRGKGPLSRFLEWLFQVTGQRGPAPDLPSQLEEGGFVAWRETVPVDGTTVCLVVAERSAER